jgi:alkylation response protein AidB-like acyl-CoA dehydrogenase
MDFSFTEDQQALQELARKILETEVTHERLKQIEAGDEWFDRKVWDALAQSQLLGVSVPEEYGGSGLGFFELCLLLEEVGRVVAPLPLHPTLVTGALPLVTFGTQEQRERFLPGVVRGETILSAALFESDSDDPMQLSTTARSDGNGWILEGVKSCVPAAKLAGAVVTPARVGADVVLLLVDPQADGVTLEPQETTRGEPEFRMTLSGVRLSGENVLGSPETGATILGWIVDRAVVGLCAMQVGVSERALRITADYTSSRSQFDRPIGSFQAVHQRAADAYIDVEAIRLTTWQAAWRLADDLPSPAEVAIAKFWAAEGGHAVGYAAQHLHGGIGVDVDYPIHRYYLWSKQIELALGSATRQLVRLGKRIAEEGSAS